MSTVGAGTGLVCGAGMDLVVTAAQTATVDTCHDDSGTQASVVNTWREGSGAQAAAACHEDSGMPQTFQSTVYSNCH